MLSHRYVERPFLRLKRRLSASVPIERTSTATRALTGA
jgi:peptidoglycan/LPS O-acetylase OafA/YrhL